MSFLSDILAARRRAIAGIRVPSVEPPPVRDFRAALARDGMSVIAEFKRASPSRGVLRADMDPAEQASAYERGGAAAVSVLTEPDYFRGSPEDLAVARSACGLPVLWKDFVLDPVQVALARSTGADAVLCIVRILDDVCLSEVLSAISSSSMTALVEVFDEDDLERALRAGADVIGVNHRDLETFEEDPEATKRLRPLVPDGVIVVGESAITTRADVQALADIGVHAVLVGEALVRADDPAAKLRELLG